MSVENIYRHLSEGAFPSTMGLIGPAEGKVIYVKAGTPSNGIAGIAPGGLGIDTSGAVVYYNSGTKTSATWSGIAAAGGTLDAAFDLGKVINGATTEANAFGVGGATDYFTFWQEGANDIRIGTSAGANITIVPAGGTLELTGNIDVSGTVKAGTANAFQVGATGNVTCVDIAAGAGNYTSTGNITINTSKFVVTGSSGDLAINTSKFTVAGATGNVVILGDVAVNTTAFTVTAATGNCGVGGDLAVAGNITGTFTGTWGATTWNANPTITLSATTGDGLTIVGTTVTSGNVMKLTADASLTGNFIVCYDSSVGGGTNQFTVADLGVTTIRGPGLGSDALNLTTGDIVVTDGNVNIITSTASAEDILDITRGNSATNGHAIDISMGTAVIAGNAINVNFGNAASTGHGFAITYSGANTGDALNINMTNNVAGGALVVLGAGTRTDALIDITDVPTTSAPTIGISATTQHNSGHVVAIDLAAGTHSCDVIHLTTTGAFTGDMLNINMANAGVGAQAIVAAGVANHTSPLVQLTATGAAGGNAISIGSTATDGTAHCISITESGTSTNNLINLAYGGAHTGDAIGILMTNAAAGAQGIVFSSAVAHTSPNVSLTSANGAAATLYMSNGSTDAAGHGISILQHGAGANDALHIAYDAAATGDAINIALTNAAVTSQALVILGVASATSRTVSVTTTNAGAASIYLSNGGTNASSHGISILQHGAVGGNAINISYDALNTADAIGILMDGAQTTAQAITIASNVAATVSPVSIADTGFVGAANVGLFHMSLGTATLADVAASMANITFTGTGQSAHMGTNLRIVSDGATNGGGVSYTAYISASAAGLEGLLVDAGTSRFDERVTLKAAGLTASNRFFGVPNHVTCGGGANDITVTLTDGDGANVTLAEGLELWIDMGATTLQAGANNINLNGAGNVRIYKSSAPTVDKAVAVAANGVVHVMYNGTSWLDMSE